MILHDYIAVRLGRRFSYGGHDCVIHAGRWAEIRTGRALVPDYSSRAEARALLAECPMLDRLRAEFAEIAVARAMPGDVVVMPSATELPALGIICGARVSCFVGRSLGWASRLDALHAFEVPSCG